MTRSHKIPAVMFLMFLAFRWTNKSNQLLTYSLEQVLKILNNLM